MSLVERKLNQLERLMQLREIWNRSLADREVLADLRIDLERQIGDTLSMRIAARFLGVSHTTIGKWVKTGDIPRVITLSGRTEIPVNFILDLREQLDHERNKGRRSLHVLEAVMCADRERAEKLKLDGLPQVVTGHQVAEIRGLAYHMVVASQLNRRLVSEALYRVYRGLRSGKLHPEYASEWEQALTRPLTEIKKMLVDPSDKASDLRQNSPFAGMLSEPERRKVLAATTNTVFST